MVISCQEGSLGSTPGPGSGWGGVAVALQNTVRHTLFRQLHSFTVRAERQRVIAGSIPVALSGVTPMLAGHPVTESLARTAFFVASRSGFGYRVLSMWFESTTVFGR